MLEENYSYRFEYYILKSDGTNITENIQLRVDSGFFLGILFLIYGCKI